MICVLLPAYKGIECAARGIGLPGPDIRAGKAARSENRHAENEIARTRSILLVHESTAVNRTATGLLPGPEADTGQP